MARDAYEAGRSKAEDRKDAAAKKPKEDPKEYLARLQKELPVEAMKEVCFTPGKQMNPICPLLLLQSCLRCLQSIGWLSAMSWNS